MTSTPVTAPVATPALRRGIVTLAATAAAVTALLAATATPASADELVPGAAPVIDPQALAVLDETNAARARFGCAPLAITDPLQATATDHSSEMAATGTMTHTGSDGSTPRVRLAAHGVSAQRTAENVAYGFDAASVVDAWMASSGHRANILDCRLTYVGIDAAEGADGLYWTQVFTSA